MAAEYRVPRLMWESLEASLRVAGKQFVKRLANALQVPEKELIKEVFKQDDMKVCIHDWTDEDFMCPASKIHEGVYVPCENVKMCGKEFCREHIACAANKPTNELCKVGNLEKDEDFNKEVGVEVDKLMYYTQLFNLVGAKADIQKLAEQAGGSAPISLTEFLATVKGYVDDDGVLKMVK